jgi:hypothetical protein
MNLPDEHHPFDWNQIAREREQKKSLLKDFFENESVDYMNDIPRATHKFLYLYGDTNTGKLTFVKEVAQETFGNDWESKVYLRIDDGQRFPYKLHAHKVESSRKVILITNKRVHWLKWKELYPATQTYVFEGQELTPSPNGSLLIQYDRYRTSRETASNDFKRSIETVLQEYVVQGKVTDDIKTQIHRKIKDLFCEFLRTEHVFHYEVHQVEQ